MLVPNREKLELQLVGLNGNAFFVLGAFRKAAVRAKWTEEEIKIVIDEATNGDYDHLLATIMDHTEPPEEWTE